jgi:NADH dehydrogenase
MSVPKSGALVVAKILIVGGGYTGFYTAFKLQKLLRRGEAEVTIVDPLPYMTYHPFLPEVAAGLIEARHVIVPLRRHLKKTHVVQGRVVNVNHAKKTATIQPSAGKAYTAKYDHIVIAAGSVSRTFPIPGVAEEAYGMKSIEEALAVRDRIIDTFAKAANLPKGKERDRLLTVTVIGGGFAGIETFAELRSLASAMLSQYPELTIADTKFHMIEAMSRVMPEVSLRTSHWVLKNLASRGATVHLDTQLKSAAGGKVELSNGISFESDLIVWTAGVMANPVVRDMDLPLDDRGRMQSSTTLQVTNNDGTVVSGAWAGGDNAAVPDITGAGVGGMCVPNAQHAVRQAKLLAKNLVAVLRGENPVEYRHKNLGSVAGLGVGYGVFQSGKIAITGFPAWLMHRGYHGLAMPMWERKFRVVGGWIMQALVGRDTTTLALRETPKSYFRAYASPSAK